MECDVNTCNFVLNVITVLGGLFGGILGAFLVWPSAKRIRKIENVLAKDRDLFDAIRRTLFDAQARKQEANYHRAVESCILVFKAFDHVASSFVILTLCRGLRDLSEIRSRLSDNGAQIRLADYLRQFLPMTDIWRNPNVVDAIQAELFVPSLVWNAYDAMASLVSCLRLQIESLGVEIGSPLFDVELLCRKLDAVLPGRSSLIKTRGTTCYWELVQELRKKLVDEIRNVAGAAPIDAEDFAKLNVSIEHAFNSHCGIPSEFRKFVVSSGEDEQGVTKAIV